MSEHGSYDGHYECDGNYNGHMFSLKVYFVATFVLEFSLEM